MPNATCEIAREWASLALSYKNNIQIIGTYSIQTFGYKIKVSWPTTIHHDGDWFNKKERHIFELCASDWFDKDNYRELSALYEDGTNHIKGKVCRERRGGWKVEHGRAPTPSTPSTQAEKYLIAARKF